MTNAELQLLVARIDTRLESIERNADLVRVSMQEQGERMASLPCARHERRISTMHSAVRQLQDGSLTERTRLGTIWQVTKILALSAVSLGGLVIAAIKLFK